MQKLTIDAKKFKTEFEKAQEHNASLSKTLEVGEGSEKKDESVLKDDIAKVDKKDDSVLEKKAVETSDLKTE